MIFIMILLMKKLLALKWRTIKDFLELGKNEMYICILLKEKEIKWSAWDHQNKNALFFNEKFGSDILNEDENKKDKLSKTLLKYIDLRKSWLNLKNFYKSLEIISEEIDEVIEKNIL